MSNTPKPTIFYCWIIVCPLTLSSFWAARARSLKDFRALEACSRSGFRVQAVLLFVRFMLSFYSATKTW